LNSSNERSKSFLLSSSTALKYPIKARYIDYQTFQQLLLDSGLETFATKEIFEIFDSSSHRLKVIDVMDVLFTFLVMYEDLAEYYSSQSQSQSQSQGMTRGGEGLSPSSLSSSPPATTAHLSDGSGKQIETDLFDNSQLYFDMFDLNHTGTIDAKNLKIILRCLLLEEKYLSHYSNTLLRHSQTPPLPPHQTLTAKRSFKSKSSHLRRRSSSSDISSVHFLGQQHSGRFQQQQQQSFETIRSMKSSDCDDLFQILDEDKNGYITYAQFKDFYDTLYLQLDSLPPSFA
jgi:Ca2+-binding EF-hand superfamily protein